MRAEACNAESATTSPDSPPSATRPAAAGGTVRRPTTPSRPRGTSVHSRRQHGIQQHEHPKLKSETKAKIISAGPAGSWHPVTDQHLHPLLARGDQTRQPRIRGRHPPTVFVLLWLEFIEGSFGMAVELEERSVRVESEQDASLQLHVYVELRESMQCEPLDVTVKPLQGHTALDYRAPARIIKQLDCFFR
jgi:hypothetical protein